jgi:hypothetical protein
MAPVIEIIDGIKIEIYSREHLPPHFHAKYGEFEVLININTGDIEEGKFPRNKLKVVKNWIADKENKLLAEKNFYELNPLLKKKSDE